MSTIDLSLNTLRRLLPLRVYATLETYTAEAEILDFITLSGDVFKIGVLILWNGEEYRNPCKAGLAMTQGMRAHFGIPETRSTTFDGWHRLKVILNDGLVLRLDELLTPEIRRNAEPFLHVPSVTDTAGQRALLEAVHGPPHLILRYTCPTQLPAAPPSRSFIAIKPYLTILSDFCGTNVVPDIVRMVKTLPVETVCEILDENARRMLAVLHESIEM